MKKNVVRGAGVVAVLVGCGAVGYAALPFANNNTTIGGCYSTGGSLKVLTPSEPTCPKGYMPIQWNVTGPPGAQGPQGPQGVQGPQGPAGPAGASGASEVFFAGGSHVVNSEDPPRLLATLTNLPAGNYQVSTTVSNDAYIPPAGGSFYVAPLDCSVNLNGQAIDLASNAEPQGLRRMWRVPEQSVSTDVVPVSASQGSTIEVVCRITTLGDEPLRRTLGAARITALQAGTINY